MYSERNETCDDPLVFVIILTRHYNENAFKRIQAFVNQDCCLNDYFIERDNRVLSSQQLSLCHTEW